MSRQFRHLQAILSNMKVEPSFPEAITKLGTSGIFNYATNKKLKTKELYTWNKLLKNDVENSPIRTPLNGFEEMILLTEQGKLWRYPIDNEYGMDREKQVPFEEHVFLDKHLQGFPEKEYIRKFMDLVIAGLARNPWMNVERKRKAIEFYKEYWQNHSSLPM